MRLIRSLISLAVLGLLAYFAVTVPLGRKTLWQHLKAIAGSRETQDLVQEVKQKAGQAIRPDSGVAQPNDDKLTPQEQKLLRKLIREKLGENAGSGKER